MTDTPPKVTPTSESVTPEPPPLGERTSAAVLAILQDFYRQEIGAEEDIHRTLPFLATSLGLIVAALNYSATQLPSWLVVVKVCDLCSASFFTWHTSGCMWLVLAVLSFILVIVLSAAVLLHLFRATRPRNYRRVGSEDVIVERTRELHAYYSGQGLRGDLLDGAVMTDLRSQLLDDFASVIPRNRELTLERYHSRARAVTALLWSLFFAFVATILIIMVTKSGLFGVSS